MDDIRDASMACPCAWGDYHLCLRCPYSWCFAHGKKRVRFSPLTGCLAIVTGWMLLGFAIHLATGVWVWP